MSKIQLFMWFTVLAAIYNAQHCTHRMANVMSTIFIIGMLLVSLTGGM